MRALIATNYTSDVSDLKLQSDIAVPTIKDGEVLIQVLSSSVNPIDYKIITGSMPLSFPKILGCDIAGKVVTSCEGCQSKVGDFVWGDLGAVVNDSALGHTEELGGYAEYAVALDDQISSMPKNLNFTEAGVLPLVALTSYKALVWYSDAPFTAPTTVLILGGSGGTGTAGIQLAKFFGAVKVIVTASASHSDLLKRLGADRIIDYHTENWWETLKSGEVDVIYDTVGQSGTADYAMKILNKNGIFVTIAGDLSNNPRDDVKQSKFFNSQTNTKSRKELSVIKRIVESRGLKPVIQQIFKFDEIKDAISLSKAGHVVGKLSISVQDL